MKTKKITKQLISLVLIVSFALTAFMLPSAALDNSYYKNWKQGDARWGSIQIADPNKYNLNNVAQIGCAMTSLSMLLVHAGAASGDVNTFNPGVLANYVKDNGGFTEDGSIYWAVGASYGSEAGFHYVNQVGLTTMSQAEKIITMRQLLNEGYYLEVAVNNSGHWIAVDNVVGDKVYMMDPARNATDLFATYSDSGIVRIVYYAGGTNSYKESYKDWKQRDPRWSGISMGTDAYDTTIGSYGCTATSFAMLLAKSGAVDSTDSTAFNPGIFVEWVREHGGFTEDGSIYWTIGGQYSDSFHYEGQIHLDGLSMAEKIELIQQMNDAGYLIEMSVKNNGHWVAVDDANSYQVTMMDPSTEEKDLFGYYDPEGVTRLVYFSGPNTSVTTDSRFVSDCEDLAIWTADYNSSVEQCENNVTQGEYSLKILSSAENDSINKISAAATAVLPEKVNISEYQSLSFDVYVSEKILSLTSRIELNLRSDSQVVCNSRTAMLGLEAGWNTITLDFGKDALTNAAYQSIDSVDFTWYNINDNTGIYFILDNIKAVRSSEYAVKLANDKIAAIPEKITFSDRAVVADAKAMFDSLTDSEKALVTDSAKLNNAVELFLLPEQDVLAITACDSADGWTAGYDSSVALSEDGAAEGTGCIVMTPPAEITNARKIGVQATAALGDKLDLSDYQNLTFQLFLNSEIKTISNFKVELYSGDSVAFSGQVNLGNLATGWNPVSLEIPQDAAAQISVVDRMVITWYNLSNLDSVEFKLDDVAAVRAPQYGIDRLTAKIDALPASITMDNKPTVDALMAAYNNMTPSEQVAVVNGAALLKAAQKLEAMQNGALGDVNQDGSVDASDALTILQSAVNKITLGAVQISLADVNFDGQINASDALNVLQYAVGKIKTF